MREHPLSEITPQAWNNIPCCLKHSLELIRDHVKNREKEERKQLLSVEEQMQDLLFYFQKLEQRVKEQEQRTFAAIDFGQKTVN